MTNESEEIVLMDEEGVEHTFYLVDVFLVEDTRYALLEYAGDDAEEDEGTFLFRVDNDGENDILIAVEDDDEFEKVTSVIETFEATDEP